jgi:hypothetical protein
MQWLWCFQGLLSNHLSLFSPLAPKKYFFNNEKSQLDDGSLILTRANVFITTGQTGKTGQTNFAFWA